MEPEKTIRGYLETAGEQIRWRRARLAVVAELAGHLEDQRNDFLNSGHPPKEAERLAVEEMGDPVAVGTELDRLHRPRPQWGLLALTVLLALAGAFLRVYLTWDWAYQNIDPGRTGITLALGIAGLLGGYFLDCSRLARRAKEVYIGALAAGMLSLWLSPHVNWKSYYTGYVVMLYPAVYALWLYACRGRGRRYLAMAVLGGVPLAVLCMWVPSVLGLLILLLTGGVLLVLAIRMDWFSVPKGRAYAMVLGLAGAVTAAFAFLLRHRLHQALHPELDPLGRGYQAIMIRASLGGAKWIGEGTLDTPHTDLPYELAMPGVNADFLPATVIHALGWLPFLLLVLAVGLLIFWLLGRCLGQRNQMGRLLALSVGLSLGLQAAFSLVLNLGIVLFSAQLPFVTGNLHTAVCMGQVGLALSVFRADGLVWTDTRHQAEDILREKAAGL